MPPPKIENSFVLQLLTGSNRIAELTVMPPRKHRPLSGIEVEDALSISEQVEL